MIETSKLVLLLYTIVYFLIWCPYNILMRRPPFSIPDFVYYYFIILYIYFGRVFCTIFPGMTGKLKEFPPMNWSASYFDASQLFIARREVFNRLISFRSFHHNLINNLFQYLAIRYIIFISRILVTICNNCSSKIKNHVSKSFTLIIHEKKITLPIPYTATTSTPSMNYYH